MSAFPEGTQPKRKDASKKQRNILLLAGIAGVALLSLLVLLASPGLLNPPNVEQEAEATDGDLGSNDTVVEILPVSDSTNSEMDDIDQDEAPIMPNNDNGFTGYVIYPGEVKDSGTGGNNGSNAQVVVPDNDDQGTGRGGGGGGGSGGGGGGGDDDDQNGGPGSGETGVCDPQYWQNHPENWPEPLSPGTTFSSVFGITIPGMEDLTLMEALGLSEGLENELLSEGAAGMLNAMHEEIDYPKSVEMVMRNVVDGLDPQILESESYLDDDDLQKRIDLLQSANDLSCPLLPSE